MVTPPAGTPYTLPSRPASDPVAAILGIVLTALGVLHVPERLGITADELATLCGTIAALAGILRAIHHRKLQATQASIPYVDPDPTNPLEIPRHLREKLLREDDR